MTDYLSHIAICGYPRSGKSTAQAVLKEVFGIVPIDDGRCLRDIAKRMFSLSEWQVSTQEGKRSKVTICGREWEVRQVLGEVGKVLETRFGPGLMPETALRDADDLFERLRMVGPPPQGFSYGSVRMQQGRIYKRRPGALVVEIDAKQRGISLSGNDFDEWDRDLVDLVIYNNSSESDFRKYVADIFEGLGFARLETPVSV
jgi:hypothetical protein